MRPAALVDRARHDGAHLWISEGGAVRIRFPDGFSRDLLAELKEQRDQVAAVLRDEGVRARPDPLTVVMGEPPALAEYIGSALWIKVGQVYQRAKRMREHPNATAYPSLVQAAEDLAKLLLDFDTAASTGQATDWRNAHKPAIKQVLSRLAGEEELSGHPLLDATLEVFQDLIPLKDLGRAHTSLLDDPGALGPCKGKGGPRALRRSWVTPPKDRASEA